MSNSVDPDETAHYEPSHLDLRCLKKPIIIARGSKRVSKMSYHTFCGSKRVKRLPILPVAVKGVKRLPILYHGVFYTFVSIRLFEK